MSMVRRSLSLLVLVLAVLSLADAQTPLRLVNVAPCRLVDTRPPNGGGPIQGGHTAVFDLQTLAESGRFCPAFSLATAQAYSLNVTLLPVSGPVGYLTIWPTGEPQPNVSLMNSDGRVKANAAIVPAGTGGDVSVFVTDSASVLIDIDAYFDGAADSSALAFFPRIPCRIVDTRGGHNGGSLQAGVERDYSIPGNCNIPSNALAYSFNVTVVPVAGGLDYLTVWPKGDARPTVSTLNDDTGTIVANAAIVPAGGQQETAFYAHNNKVDLLLDVNGYFAPANTAPFPLSLYTLTPCRILDTRNGIGLFNGIIPIGIVGSACGIPSIITSEAFVLNATVVPQGGLGYLTLWPEGFSQPTGSTLNAPDGAITSNMAIVPAGTGNSINAYAISNTQLILDISSYFAPIATLSVESGSLPNGALNDGYSVQLVATGGVSPYTWMRTGGNLPTGLNLTTGGLIQGTTTATGPFNFMVTVTDSNSPAGMANANLQINVNSGVGTLTVTTTALADGMINNPYNALLTANGGVTPYSWSISSGALPAGLSLNSSTGQISGVPGAAGITNLTVKVTDSQHHAATHPLSLTVNTGGASGTLNGKYAFSFEGYTANTFGVVVGSFTSDGGGNINRGEVDSISAGGIPQHSQINTGSYSIDANGLGSITFTAGSQNFQLLVATGAGEDMRIIAFNQNGTNGTWGSGVLRQQNPSDFIETALTGNWAFGAQGFDASGNPLSLDGAFHLDSSGNLNGIEDSNDFGNHIQSTLTGHVTTGIDSNGRGTKQLQVTGVGTVNIAEYVISANETVSMQIDSGGRLYVQNALRQNGTMNNGILHGNSVGRGSRIQGAGGGHPNSQALALLFGADGNGNLSIAEDINTGGTFTQASLTGMYTVASNSRAVLTLSNGATVVCYIVSMNQTFCINTAGSGNDAAGAEVLYFEPQAAGPFSAGSFSGEYLGGSRAQYLSSYPSQVDSNFASGNGTFASTYSQSGPGGTNQNQTLSGTYTVNSTTGAITISQNGTHVYYGFVISLAKASLVTGNGFAPLALFESRSSAPHHF